MRLTAYHYDSQNRLSLVEYQGRREELFYDKAGNRSRRMVNGLEETYTYDKRNRLTERSVGEQVETYSYDNAGNLIRDGHAEYTYDAFNRMEKAETFDGHIQINRYDAEGLRYEMEENGKLVRFIFRDREVIAEEKKEETVRYIRGLELLASDAKHARTYYHYAGDELGSITHVTAGAEILNRYEYDAWGNTVLCQEQTENRFRFNGQQYDTVTQQYYLRARFYNPVIGRFTQEDIYRGDGLNLYAYCRNNPVYYVDPSGNICDKAANIIREKIENGTATKNERRKLAAYEKNQNRILQNELNGGKNSNKQKGNFGEVVADHYMRNSSRLHDAGYYLKSIGREAPSGLDDKIVKGIDGIYENINPNSDTKYVINEVKFNSSDLGKTSDGKQMSYSWLTKTRAGRNRIEQAVGNKQLSADVQQELRFGRVKLVQTTVRGHNDVSVIELKTNGGMVSRGNGFPE